MRCAYFKQVLSGSRFIQSERQQRNHIFVKSKKPGDITKVEHDLLQDAKIECRLSDEHGNEPGIGCMLEDESQYIGSKPKETICPLCRSEIRTVIHHEASVESHLLALIFCVFYCIPCVLVPYCMTMCKNTNHYCPNCGSLIGVFSK